MGNKPNWGRGAYSLGNALLQYAQQRDRQDFWREQEDTRNQTHLEREAARAAAAEERMRLQNELIAQRQQDAFDRNPMNQVPFAEGAMIPGGTEVPFAGKTLGEIDAWNSVLGQGEEPTMTPYQQATLDLRREMWEADQASPDPIQQPKPARIGEVNDIADYAVGPRMKVDDDFVNAGGAAFKRDFLKEYPLLADATVAALSDSASIGPISPETGINAGVDVARRDDIALPFVEKEGWEWDEDRGEFVQPRRGLRNIWQDEMSPVDFANEKMTPALKAAAGDLKTQYQIMENTLAKMGLTVEEYLALVDGGGTIPNIDGDELDSVFGD